MIRVVVIVVVTAVVVFALGARPHARAWYAERATMMTSFDTPGPRSCGALLTTGGHFMGGALHRLPAGPPDSARLLEEMAAWVKVHEPGV